MEYVKTKIKRLGFLGGMLTGLGGLGALGVCHTICQTIIIGLAAAGITIIGMPLAFLENKWFITGSFGLGLTFLAISLLVFLKHRTMHVLPKNVKEEKPKCEHPEKHDCCHAS